MPISVGALDLTLLSTKRFACLRSPACSAGQSGTQAGPNSLKMKDFYKF